MGADAPPVALDLEDRAAIERTLHRYAWAADDRDFTRLATCFSEDAQVSFGGAPPLVGREAVLAYMQERTGVLTASMHAMSTVTADVEEGEVVARSYCTASLVTGSGANATVVRRAVRYVDRMVRVDGAWVIRDRVHTPLWTETQACEVAG